MNLSRVDQIAKAVLYEGYMLYPYRPSSVKNRQRWNFGVLYPQTHSDAQEAGESSTMRTECLVSGSLKARLEVKLRFLQLRLRSIEQDSPNPSALPNGWQEAVERDVSLPAFTVQELLEGMQRHAFSFPAQTMVEEGGIKTGTGRVIYRESAVEGIVETGAERVHPDTFKIGVLVRNTTPMPTPAVSRDAALMHSLVSTHLVLGIGDGEFVSLLEPPPELQDVAAQCRNFGVWPVLVGAPGQRDTVLASPIILYDYPQIAPESVGDLFDGTEIDEILSLRIMTLTDEEKREMRASDERARRILERTETLSAEQFMKLHGAVRGKGTLKENDP